MDELARNAVARLGSRSRSRFLGLLVGELAVAGRCFYVEAGNTPDTALAGLRCVNECLNVLGNQFLANIGSGASYPDNAFVHSVLQSAQVDGCEQVVRAAIQRALELNT